MDQTANLSLVMLLALLPAVGTIAGILLAESGSAPAGLRGAALHAAAGFAAAIAALEFLPRSQERTEGWLVAMGFIAGAVISFGLSRLTILVSRKLERSYGAGGAWGGYSVVLIDLASDGLLTGSGASIARNLGLLLAGSQLVANLPGGFAAAASLKASELPKKARYISFLVFLAAPLVTALFGYLLLRGAANPVIGFTLALLAGLLLLATIEDLVPEADEPGAPRHLSSPAFAAGFVSLMLITIYLGN